MGEVLCEIAHWVLEKSEVGQLVHYLKLKTTAVCWEDRSLKPELKGLARSRTEPPVGRSKYEQELRPQRVI